MTCICVRAWHFKKKVFKKYILGKTQLFGVFLFAMDPPLPKFVKRPFIRLWYAIFTLQYIRRNPRSRHRHPQPGGPLGEERPGPRRPPGRVRGRREAMPLRAGGAPQHGRSGSSSISPPPAAAVRRQGPHEPRCRPQVSLLPGRRSCDHHSRVPFSFSYARYSQFGQFHIIPSFAPCCRKETI